MRGGECLPNSQNMQFLLRLLIVRKSGILGLAVKSRKYTKFGKMPQKTKLILVRPEKGPHSLIEKSGKILNTNSEKYSEKYSGKLRKILPKNQDHRDNIIFSNYAAAPLSQNYTKPTGTKLYTIHGAPYQANLLVSVTDERTSFLIDDFKKKLNQIVNLIAFLLFSLFRQNSHSKLTWCAQTAKTCSWHFKSVKTVAASSPPLSTPTSSAVENKQSNLHRCRVPDKIVALCENRKRGTLSEQIYNSCIGIGKDVFKSVLQWNI